MLSLVTALGLLGEERRWFGKVAGALFIIAAMAFLANLGLVPSAATQDVPFYGVVFDFFVPLAIPLLLFGANLKSLFSESRRLVIIFLLGTVGVLLGAAISFFLFDLGPNTNKVVGVFAATLIGGSVNFVATAETLGFSSDPLFATAAAVDNLFANGYIFLLFLLPSIQSLRSRFVAAPVEEQSTRNNQTEIKTKEDSFLLKLGLAFAIAAVICWLGQWLGSGIQSLTASSLNLEILVSTVLILVVANIPLFNLSKLEDIAFSAGMLLLLVFLGVIGTAVSLKVVFEAGPAVMYICITTISIHLIFTLLSARLLNISLEEVLISSAANTAGPSISAPLAATIGLKHLVSSAVLLGVLGYALGTFLGVGLAQLLSLL